MGVAVSVRCPSDHKHPLGTGTAEYPRGHTQICNKNRISGSGARWGPAAGHRGGINTQQEIQISREVKRQLHMLSWALHVLLRNCCTARCGGPASKTTNRYAVLKQHTAPGIERSKHRDTTESADNSCDLIATIPKPSMRSPQAPHALMCETMLKTTRAHKCRADFAFLAHSIANTTSPASFSLTDATQPLNGKLVSTEANMELIGALPGPCCLLHTDRTHVLLSCSYIRCMRYRTVVCGWRERLWASGKATLRQRWLSQALLESAARIVAPHAILRAE